MGNLNEAFTAAVWVVKPGKEEEFISEWTKFAKWSAEADTVTGRLLQDTDNPSRFISVGKWDETEAIKRWQERADFKEKLSKLTELLAEPSTPRVMKEVAKVGEMIFV